MGRKVRKREREKENFGTERTDRSEEKRDLHTLCAVMFCVSGAVSLRRDVCRRFTVSMCNPINLAFIRRYCRRGYNSPRSFVMGRGLCNVNHPVRDDEELRNDIVAPLFFSI